MASEKYRWLQLRQLDKKLAAARAGREALPTPAKGWIRTIRETLGMSAGQLAGRLGVEQSTVTRLEQSERDGTASLNSIQRAAEVLDCDVHYLLVPRKSLETTVLRQAHEIARADVSRAGRTMSLEDQATDASVVEEQFEERRDTLLRGSWRNLWK